MSTHNQSFCEELEGIASALRILLYCALCCLTIVYQLRTLHSIEWHDDCEVCRLCQLGIEKTHTKFR